jgi:hypothetical protein
MNQPQPGQALAEGPGIMLLSAALFGYFGFMMAFPEIDVQTGLTNPLVVTLKWGLRATAIALLPAAVVTMMAPLPGNLLYSLVGLASSVFFLVIVGWDLAAPYDSGVHPALLLLFAAWNGYGSWTGLRRGMRFRRDRGRNPGPPPDR